MSEYDEDDEANAAVESLMTDAPAVKEKPQKPKVVNQISGASAPEPAAALPSKKKVLKKSNFGSILGDLVNSLAPQGLPPDVEHIVNLCIRYGYTENDHQWAFYLPLLLRQVTAEAQAIQLEAFLGALINKMPQPVKGTQKVKIDFDSDDLVGSINTMRKELSKVPRRVGETIKPSLFEAVADAMQSAPNKLRVVVDDTKLMDATKDALLNVYFASACLGGLACTIIAFIVGARFG